MGTADAFDSHGHRGAGPRWRRTAVAAAAVSGAPQLRAAAAVAADAWGEYVAAADTGPGSARAISSLRDAW